MVATTAFLAASAAAAAAQTTTNLLDLAGCEAYALARSPRLLQRNYDPLNQALRTDVARQRFAGSFGLQSSYDPDGEQVDGKVSWKQEVPGGIDVTASAGATQEESGDTSRSYTLGVSKRVLGGGSLGWSRTEVRNAELEESAVGLRLARFRRELVADVRKAYYQVLRNRLTLSARERQLDSARRNLQSALAREEPLDIATAQIEVPASEAAVLRARRAVLTSLDALRELIGMPLEQVLDIPDEQVYRPQTVNPAADLAASLAMHEDIRALGIRLAQLTNEVESLREEAAPGLVLGTEVGLRDADDTERDWSSRFTVGLDWTPGLRAARAQVRLKEYALDDARLELEIARRRLQTTIDDLARRLDEALAQVDISARRLDVAGRRAKLYEDRWQNGEIDILEYVRSQNDLEDNRVGVIDAQIGYLETLADYRALCGER
jgi:outer membrane protein TolC